MKYHKWLFGSIVFSITHTHTHTPGVSITLRIWPFGSVEPCSTQAVVTPDAHQLDLKACLQRMLFPVALLPLPERPTRTRVLAGFCCTPKSQFTSKTDPSSGEDSDSTGRSVKSEQRTIETFYEKILALHLVFVFLSPNVTLLLEQRTSTTSQQ